MMSRLTQGFKPIQLPVNSNLLAVVSMIIFCAVAFVTLNTIALACDRTAVDAAYKTAVAAIKAANKAVEARDAAVETGNWELIEQAQEYAEAAVENAKAAVDAHAELAQEYIDCLSGSSGGCDSGGCG